MSLALPAPAVPCGWPASRRPPRAWRNLATPPCWTGPALVPGFLFAAPPGTLRPQGRMATSS